MRANVSSHLQQEVRRDGSGGKSGSFIAKWRERQKQILKRILSSVLHQSFFGIKSQLCQHFLSIVLKSTYIICRKYPETAQHLCLINKSQRTTFAKACLQIGQKIKMAKHGLSPSLKKGTAHLKKTLTVLLSYERT